MSSNFDRNALRPVKCAIRKVGVTTIVANCVAFRAQPAETSLAVVSSGLREGGILQLGLCVPQPKEGGISIIHAARSCSQQRVGETCASPASINIGLSCQVYKSGGWVRLYVPPRHEYPHRTDNLILPRPPVTSNPCTNTTRIHPLSLHRQN